MGGREPLAEVFRYLLYFCRREIAHFYEQRADGCMDMSQMGADPTPAAALLAGRDASSSRPPSLAATAKV